MREGEGGECRAFFPLLRAYTVCDASRIDSLSDSVPQEAKNTDGGRQAEQTIVAATGIDVHPDGYHAYYAPASGVTYVPPAHAFNGADRWAELAFHELDNATGPLSHLDRRRSTIFGSSDNAFRDLTGSLARHQ